MSVVTFLSDYGLEDDFVGVCHGVLARIAPEVRVIDITHGIARHDVRAGAIVLRRALAYMPAGVHMAVVDPGVGSRRRAVALRCGAGDEQRLLVGPDNGLLMLAAQRLGGVVEAVEIGSCGLASPSATFHGRDIFAPVAARLASGTPLERAGDSLDPAQLVRLALPCAEVGDGELIAHVLLADGYGNVSLDADLDVLAASGLRVGEAVIVNGCDAVFATTFADVAPGALLLYVDGYGALSLAVNRGSAIDELGLSIDGDVRIARRV
jgi:S-adenosylmethionine hydrolase